MNNKGFTLIELIVVIAIIAVLAVVLAPQYIQYVERSRESNDLQIAQSIIDATVLSLADPSLDITRGVIVEIGWCTDGRHTPDGAIIVRPVYTGATSDLVGTAPNISINDKSLEELDITISNILNAQAGDFSYAGNNDKDLRGINDAESVFGNSADFAFHINTTTGEYDIVTDTVWSEKFNIK